MGPAYNFLICLFTSECMICCCCSVPACNSLFWWSHMSHDTSHSFWMRAAVHLKLDLHDFPIFHIFSWWSLQLCDSHPSDILSHPIFCCSSTNELAVCLGGSSLAHCWRYPMIVYHKIRSVPCSFSHLFSLVILISHCVCALGVGHLSICILSSRFVWHCGHCAEEFAHVVPYSFHVKSVW